VKNKMQKILTRLSAGIASAALLGATVVAPAFATPAVDGISIIGNGTDSTNKVYVDNSSSTYVKQSNSVEAVIGIDSSSNSGGNKANGNTGGSTSIATGDATSNVDVVVVGGVNVALTDGCGCVPEEQDVTIAGNGSDSYNKVKLNNASSQTVKQKNTVSTAIGITSVAKTGKNKANNNTGSGTGITTGDSKSKVGVLVGGGLNLLNP
jgi:hypothetical protein